MPKAQLSPLLRFAPEANKLPSDELRIAVPFHVLLGEAVDTARFFQKYFASVPAEGDEPGRPGLDTVVNAKKGLTVTTGKDLLALERAVHEAQTAYLLASSPKGAAPMVRGRALVDEIAAVLEWHFDDGVEDERDAQLASVVQAHESTPDSADALAAELDDYSALANVYREELDGLGGFDVATIDEAKSVAAALRDRPALPVPVSEDARKALALRNRMATLLSLRINVVRAAARFVFRGSPDIIREATSVYERKRRAAARKNAAKLPVEKQAPAPK